VNHGIEGLVRKHSLADVALKGFDAFGQWFLRRNVVEGGDFVTSGGKVMDGVGADEAGRSGDEQGARFGINGLRGESTGR